MELAHFTLFRTITNMLTAVTVTFLVLFLSGIAHGSRSYQHTPYSITEASSNGRNVPKRFTNSSKILRAQRSFQLEQGSYYKSAKQPTVSPNNILNSSSAVPFEMEHLVPRVYSSNNNSALYMNDRRYQTPNSYNNAPLTGKKGAFRQLSEKKYSDLQNTPKSHYRFYSDEASNPHFQQLDNRNEEHASFDIQDKVFTKTIIATKILKVAKTVFTFCMLLVMLAIAGLGHLGISVSPVMLPFALLPIGIVALLLFIPLCTLFVPLAASGVIGERRRRRRNTPREYSQASLVLEEFVLSIQDHLPTLLDRVTKFQCRDH